MDELMTDTLLAEYEAIITDLRNDATDEQIIHALIGQSAWTEQGARTVVKLARQYGVFVLRNALALGTAMGLEDGDAGL